MSLNFEVGLRQKRTYCCIRTCVNYYNVLNEKCFHFPGNKKIAEKWVQAINNCDLVIEEADTYRRNKHVCHRHFATHQFTTPERLRLNRGAIPTLNLSSDNPESGLSLLLNHKKRYPTTNDDADMATRDEHQPEETHVKEETCIDLQSPQNEQLEMPIQDDVQSGADIFREDSMSMHVGDAAVSQEEVFETCDTASEHIDDDEYQDENFISNEPCTVATDSWQNLPNQLCRLCASTDEHPKQSIVGWLDMLNEIIPDLVALHDGLPQHVCRPCANKLYTCNRIKADFIEAYDKFQEIIGFTKLSGIQFMDLHGYAQQSIDNVIKEEIVSEVSAEEETVSGISVEEEKVSGISANDISSEDILQDEVMTSDIVDVASLNFEEHLDSHTGEEGNLCENFTQDESDSVNNVSDAYDIQRQDVQDRKTEKFKYVCAECEEIFTKKGDLRAHRQTHARVFECEYCSKQFQSLEQIEDHRRIHTKELPFMCEVCGKCFRNMTQLKNHEYVHKPPRYSCPVCHKKFHSSVYLTQHRKVHSTDTKLICELCGKMLYTPHSLKVHLRIHTGEKPFQCAVCGICFISANRLRHHRFFHTDIKFQCDTCNKEFRFKKSLVVHQQRHIKLKRYKCPICFKAFAYSCNRRRHRKENCKPVCVVCNKIFLTDELVEEHRTNEHTQEEVAAAAAKVRREQSERTKNTEFVDNCCPVCSQTIYGKGNMLKHIKEYHRDHNYKPFACEQCSKTFSTASVLHRHSIWHSKNRSFTCATCGKKFKTKNTLKWHDLSVHQNVHPFQCQYCDRRFKRLSDLIVHKRKHTGERPYPCPICVRTFVTKSDMLKHAKKHTQNSDNVAWKEMVDVTTSASDAFLCDISVTEEVV